MIFLDVNHPREVEPVIEFAEQYNRYDHFRRAKNGAIVLMAQNINLATELSRQTHIQNMIPKPLNSQTILEQFKKAQLRFREGK